MYTLNYRTIRIRNPKTREVKVIRVGDEFNEADIPTELLKKLVRIGKVSKDGVKAEPTKAKTKSKTKGKK